MQPQQRPNLTGRIPSAYSMAPQIYIDTRAIAFANVKPVVIIVRESHFSFRCLLD